MRRICGLVMATALLLSGVQASAQSVTFDFETGDDQGWGNKFSDGSATFPVVNIGGSQRMAVLRNGDFQEAEYNTGNATDPFFLAMSAAALNEALYQISYDYYIDTANWGTGGGTFLQLGTYVNSGSGYYAQNEKDIELDGTQLASGALFQGTITETFAAKGYNIPPNGTVLLPETFFRLGLIINGDGPAQLVHYDNIRVSLIPEPASLALVGLAATAMIMARRRSAPKSY